MKYHQLNIMLVIRETLKTKQKLIGELRKSGKTAQLGDLNFQMVVRDLNLFGIIGYLILIQHKRDNKSFFFVMSVSLFPHSLVFILKSI